ncbi:ABC transporter ATP-binding protein [Alkalilimnicola sp. S0819]|uniref:ABC transporter ATP-binding protein n=1 Tax=Alkalilimnicola sp. S0819 TaxID=2613922 RepID=UPI001261E38C|nr:ABC transporter ATP-binding protein [Alkalilimnicola sp. S0819]KAB7628294.1 ABC transporter ATP-binding protein [Alkalilimnicola sp. S0819]MPQ15191.1 ATP-binding cassette domain-containing protein [Alkalilimnicola sp. S0819]
MSENPVLETQDLTIRFGGHVAVDSVSCKFYPGTLTSIVGPNGAGKTTYFNLISGQLPASAGRVTFYGEDITRLPAPARADRGVGRAFQLTNLFPQLTVLENCRLAVASRHGIGHNFWSMAAKRRDLTDRAMSYLEQVSLAKKAMQPAAMLPHGDQRKLEVGLLLALEPKIFMFDEPTAGMSVDEVPVILDLIQDIKKQTDKTILLVEHKMDVVRSLSDRIIVLHNGQLVADGEPAEVIASPVVQEAYLGAAPSAAEEQQETPA